MFYYFCHLFFINKLTKSVESIKIFSERKVIIISVKENLLKVLCERDESVSGEELAKEFGVTRNAIWKAAEELKRDGYKINSVKRRGYSLSKKNEKLCIEELKRYIKTEKIIFLNETDSTNTVLKKAAADGEKAGTLVISEKQTSGKGRLGRQFFSPDGGIYFSLLLRPKKEIKNAMLITTAAATAVAEEIEKFSGRRADIKWVNDIYIDRKKVCGILTEGALTAETALIEYAVLGIGINLTEPENGYPQEIKSTAAAVFGKEKINSETKSKLIGAIIEKFYSYYENIERREYMDEYRKRSFLIGKEVEFIKNGEKHIAEVTGIDNDARLETEENGEKIIIGAGEVSVKWK